MKLLSNWVGAFVFGLLKYVLAQAESATPTSTPLWADRKVEFRIELQRLSDALNEFGHQADITISMADDGVGDKHTHQSLRGVYSIAKGLRKLLAHSGLRANFGEKGIVVEPDPGESGQAARADVERFPQQKTKPHIREPLVAADLAEIVVRSDPGTHLYNARADSSPERVYGKEALEQSGAATVAGFFAILPETYNAILTVVCQFCRPYATGQQSFMHRTSLAVGRKGPSWRLMETGWWAAGVRERSSTCPCFRRMPSPRLSE
jgi:hypothetical protein